MGAVHRIVGIVTQGNSDGADWVTQYTLSYSDDDVNFIGYPPESATPRVCCYVVIFLSKRYKCAVYDTFMEDLRIKFQLSLIVVSILSDQLNRFVHDHVTFSDHPCVYVFQIFEGNVDENSYVAHVIDPYMFGTFIRVNVVSFNSRPCMRFEISGTAGILQKRIIGNAPFKVYSHSFLKRL